MMPIKQVRENNDVNDFFFWNYARIYLTKIVLLFIFTSMSSGLYTMITATGKPQNRCILGNFLANPLARFINSSIN